MNTKNYYIPSLNDLVRFLHIKPVFAKSPCSRKSSPVRQGSNSNPPVDTSGGGDVPSPRKHIPSCDVKGTDKDTASNRGKTGAGVTGSRKSQCSDKIKKGGSDDLPASAHNPGLLRYIHNAARLRLPQCFEGATVSVKHGATSNWILGHSMLFSSVSPGGYKVLMSYLEKNNTSAVPYFILEAAPGGQISCEIRVGPTRGTRATVIAQSAERELRSFETILDTYFNDFTLSVIAVNKEFIAIHWLKAISEQFSLGAEVVARGQDKNVNSASAAARWFNNENSLSATLGNRGLDVCFAKSINPYLTVASMLEIGFAVRRAVATLAYEWQAGDWSVRGSMDSDGLVGATLHKELGGKRAHLGYAISALLNHPNDKFRLGFGITATID